MQIRAKIRTTPGPYPSTTYSNFSGNYHTEKENPSGFSFLLRKINCLLIKLLPMPDREAQSGKYTVFSCGSVVDDAK